MLIKLLYVPILNTFYMSNYATGGVNPTFLNYAPSI